MAEARRELVRAWPDLVKTVIWYGAVDLNVKHLVVWVILKGPPEELPKWFFPSGDPRLDEPQAKGKLDQLNAMAATVRGAFAKQGWPNAAGIHVGFESDERVAESGGWEYFK